MEEPSGVTNRGKQASFHHPIETDTFRFGLKSKVLIYLFFYQTRGQTEGTLENIETLRNQAKSEQLCTNPLFIDHIGEL